MTTKPLKRHAGLVELSRDHHHGLLLSWKIRQGLKKEIEPEAGKATGLRIETTLGFTVKKIVPS